MKTFQILLVISSLVALSFQSVVRSAAEEEASGGEIANSDVSNNPNDVEFYLYPNAANVLDYDKLVYNNINSITNSRYNPSKNLIIYTSGFMQNFTTDQEIKNAYLTAGFASSSNIIVVDWGKLSGNKAKIPAYFVDLFIVNLYAKVKDNVDVVGGRIYEFIRFLQNNGKLAAGPQNVHIVGQSMGAHIAGAAGRDYQRATGVQIGRITGTDAAGPLFQGISTDKRLDASDAVFVDSLHTNDGGYGYSGAFADADFFVNGGKAPQPGCDGTETFCSHNMAVAYYAKSIIDPSLRGTSLTDSSHIEFGHFTPTHARGSYNVETTPFY